jgi:ribonuclease Z
MKPSFHARLLNGPFDDPGLYIRILREGRAFMFDLGFTTSLSSRDILKITDIFVSHTHVDHFIGFDNILRICLKKANPLKLYGPEGFIDCIEGKLKSYTWNLIGDYPLVIEVSEVNEKLINKVIFKAENSFKREDLGWSYFRGTLIQDSSFKVSTAILDHQVPCLAFSLEEAFHINIDKAKLGGLNLPVGKWLKELKTAIRENKHDSVFTIEGKTFTFSELRLEKDKDRAIDRYHLTAKNAGRIAREAEVGRLEVFHFSPRYKNDPASLIQEAEEQFRK